MINFFPVAAAGSRAGSRIGSAAGSRAPSALGSKAGSRAPSAVPSRFSCQNYCKSFFIF